MDQHANKLPGDLAVFEAILTRLPPGWKAWNMFTELLKASWRKRHRRAEFCLLASFIFRCHGMLSTNPTNTVTRIETLQGSDQFPNITRAFAPRSGRFRMYDPAAPSASPASITPGNSLGPSSPKTQAGRSVCWRKIASGAPFSWVDCQLLAQRDSMAGLSALIFLG